LVLLRSGDIHHGGPQGAQPKAEDIAKILADVEEGMA